ncbi:hypothetical protein Fmac_021613 [Flemingia macrophylla]|uniref:Guanylate-binding protein/Atlastin C-terminal domain-containing protein n=1 Tax=Flemingia macrophylla TaxID=520843 RepID=A0ABD1LXF8_9FABA
MASVEEAECRRAYDSATNIYMSIFYRSTPPDEVAMREAHEQAVQKSMASFNAGAVGVGSARKKYEDLLQKFFKKAFEIMIAFTYHRKGALVSCKYRDINKKFWQV